MDKKTMFLAVLSTTSLIIGADLATRLYRAEIALQIAQQRVEVLEVQAQNSGQMLEIHDDWFNEYLESGKIQILDKAQKAEELGKHKASETKIDELKAEVF